MSSRGDEIGAALDEVRAARATRPPTLFDDPTPERAPKAKVIKAVERNAPSQWVEHAFEAVRTAARRHEELTVDDVNPFITEPDHDPRAIGAVMLRAARAGIIERQSGQFRISERREGHIRPLALWRSLIYIRLVS